MKKDLSVVIPVFNAEICIEQLVTEVYENLKNKNIEFEIIVVNDNSSDGSWSVIKKIKNTIPVVKAFSLSKNFGQHKATLCGLNNSCGEIVVTLDDDFEHNPDKIFTLYQSLIDSDYDMMYALPNNIKKPIHRKFFTYMYKFFSKIETKDVIKGSSFRALNRTLINKISNHNNHLFFIDELVLWYTSNIGTVQFNFGSSKKQKSGYSFILLFSLSSKVILMGSVLPLKLVRTLGLSMSLISFFIGLFYFIKKITSDSIPSGYSSIIVSVLFSTGMILLCMAIIGEYLGNLLFLQNNKPGYVIREEL